jgi:hypothetical protein
MIGIDMNWNWVESRADLHDFLAQVIVCAPDDFIEVDYLSAEDQLDLEKAFGELSRGMTYLAESIADPSQLERLQNLLDRSLAAYREGDSVKGAQLLQDFERLAFK